MIIEVVIGMKTLLSKEKNEMIANLLTSIFLLHPELAAIQIDSLKKKLKLKYFLVESINISERIKTIELLWKSYLNLKKAGNHILKIDFCNLENYVMIEVLRDLDTFNLEELKFIIDAGKGLGLNFVSDEYLDLLDYIEVDEQQISLLLENTKKNLYQKVFAFREEGRVVIAN